MKISGFYNKTADTIDFSLFMKFQPVFAILTSITCLILFRRGFEYVPLAIVLFIFAFFYVMFRIYINRQNSASAAKMWDAALLFALNNMLLFVLPFYIESTTLLSRNVVFAPVVIGLTVVAHIYNLYQNKIVNNPLTASVFYSLIFFCVLNFLFPVVFGVRNKWSILLSGLISVIAAFVYVYPHSTILKGKINTIKLILGLCFLFIFLWIGRSWIPPVPLKVTYATACESINEHTPVNPFNKIFFESEKQIYFFTAIFAPRGLSEKISHVWYFNGKKLLTIELKEITGGRNDGFRTWSRHALLEGAGKYTVEVWSSGGQMLGSGSFIIDTPQINLLNTNEPETDPLI